MTCLQTKITTYPALPIIDISPLEKLILSKVLDCAEIDGGLELYTDSGPMNLIVVSRRELMEAMDTPDQVNESLLKRFVRERVLSILPAEDLDPESVVFIDLSEFPWQFVVQDIVTRSPTARELVVIQWISDPSQRPDTFGASVSLITETAFSTLRARTCWRISASATRRSRPERRMAVAVPGHISTVLLSLQAIPTTPSMPS